MTIGTPLVTFCLRVTLFSFPLLTFLIGWTGGVSRYLEILFSGSAPQTAVWANSWDDLRKHTARSIGILLTCATCFIIYGAHQKRTFLDTTRDIGFTVFSKHSITMLCFAFSGWYVSHFGAGFIARTLSTYIPRYDIATGAVPPENTVSFFLATIQAGPTEELALVPLFLLLIPAAFPKRYRRWGLGVAITLAIAARVSFHLYYGPTAFVQHSIWAAGVIITWLITRNVLGLILAHSCSNGLLSLAISPAYSWLVYLHLCIFFICLIVLLGTLAKALERRRETKKLAESSSS